MGLNGEDIKRKIDVIKRMRVWKEDLEDIERNVRKA